MRYISTRGAAPAVGFAQATLAGLAPDGGLYVPEKFPAIADVEALADISYVAAASKIMLPFVGDDIAADALKTILQEAYATFDTPDPAPLRPLGENFYVMELFHGPTLAFKDVALQVLGRLFDHLLQQRNSRAVIIGATSGDTGSAAIHAFQGSARADIFILHPKGRVSEVQRRQMTTVDAPNVFNVAIEGSFDDCQDIVKAMLGDAALQAALNLSAINSINWARILAQSVYYARASAQIRSITGKAPVFCVPTGNFGNVYAGYVAQRMGTPIEKLLIATNSNDILFRLFESAKMKMQGVVPTLSPSMDIQVSSNFERLLFDLYDRDGAKVAESMQRFRKEGAYALSADAAGKMKEVFFANRASEEDTLATMRDAYERQGYMADPHTAVGMHVAKRWQQEHKAVPIVTLATAHPAKFPDAVKKALSVPPPVPQALQAIFSLPENYATLPADKDAVTRFVQARAKH